jgi:hypothetical protein
LNDIAKENTSLRTQLEELNLQLENERLSKKGRENEKGQLPSVPEPFSLHPAQGKVPIRKEGRNGRAWSEYQKRLKDVFTIYGDVAFEVVSEMMNQGFTDHDIIDALFPTSSGGRRISTHNAGLCALYPTLEGSE